MSVKNLVLCRPAPHLIPHAGTLKTFPKKTDGIFMRNVEETVIIWHSAVETKNVLSVKQRTIKQEIKI